MLSSRPMAIDLVRDTKKEEVQRSDMLDDRYEHRVLLNTDLYSLFCCTYNSAFSIQYHKLNHLVCSLFFFFLGHTLQHVVHPKSGIEPMPLHQKCRVLTSGPRKSSMQLYYLISFTWHNPFEFHPCCVYQQFVNI